LVEYIASLIREIEEILGIDPGLDVRTILEIAAKRIVEDLHAEAGSIRLFDPETLKMTSFGAYRYAEEERLTDIPFHASIAGRVVRENRSIPVPSLLKDPSYQNKEIVARKGFHSLLAVPLRIPRFLGPEGDVLGSLQIYFQEENRKFDRLFVMHAELLARRVSFVLAKKKVLDLRKLNEKKERIVEKIFVKLSNREGIKLRDLFVQLIPELEECLHVQSCSLFTVSRDQKFIRMEAAYPLDQIYHKPGYTFTVSHHPYFQTIISGCDQSGDFSFERFDPSYLLIKDPIQSRLVSPGIRKFAEKNQVHSVLMVPFRVNEKVRYLMVFYAMERRQYFTDEEIELLSFFGREIMKAARLELLDDVLHDFKNPAIAIAGFAGRARKMLESENLEEVREKLSSYLDIVVRETNRLQDLTLAMSVEGREQVVDLSRTAGDRFQVNQEAILESRRKNIRIVPPDFETDLFVFCSQFGLERVLDNLLNNATRAIPGPGGVLSIRSYSEKDMACLEIRNTGEIAREKLEEIGRGEVRGRGLNIVYRFIQANHGRMKMWTESGETVCAVQLPMYRPGES